MMEAQKATANMFEIEKRKLPANTLLQSYAAIEGGYTDCYSTEIDSVVSLSDFVGAFYVTWLFKLERFVLKHAASRPSTDSQARDVAEGKINQFAAWTVEQREDRQLLMCDMHSRTRSWFMIAPQPDQGKSTTRLYFGTAVTPLAPKGDRKPSIGFAFHAMLGFHKLYSRALLSAAKSQLARLRDAH